MRTYIDNAPEEEGTQLILSAALTADEEVQVRALGADYDEDYFQGALEHAWINCSEDEKDQVVQLLATFGITKAPVDKS